LTECRWLVNASRKLPGSKQAGIRHEAQAGLQALAQVAGHVDRCSENCKAAFLNRET
jgi:hypothetical protein